MNVNERSYRQNVFDLVKRIPRGKVMTYGQIAEILGEGYTARTIGYAMHGADEQVPWQRVINAQGKCSTGLARAGITSWKSTAACPLVCW